MRRARNSSRSAPRNSCIGVLSIVGLIVTDAAVKRVDWTAPGTWLWLALVALDRAHRPDQARRREVARLSGTLGQGLPGAYSTARLPAG